MARKPAEAADDNAVAIRSSVPAAVVPGPEPEFFNPGPGVYYDVPNETYHAGAGISKSGLFDLYKKTPRHYRFGERKDSKNFDMGDGVHAAILEPGRFDAKFIRGPEDRRGNIWKDMSVGAKLDGKTLLTAGDHDKARYIRDAAWANADVAFWLSGMILVEPSAYWVDEETGLTLRCRPDAVNAGRGAKIDLKSTVAADSYHFSKSIEEYGYHVQEAIYTHGWDEAVRASGREYAKTDVFVFIALEKSAPYEAVAYEIEPSAVQEGWAIYRQALLTYKSCLDRETVMMGKIHGADPVAVEEWRRQCWPGYATGVQAIDIPAHGYRLTRRAGQS